jgi:hypothetical protein
MNLLLQIVHAYPLNVGKCELETNQVLGLQLEEEEQGKVGIHVMLRLNRKGQRKDGRRRTRKNMKNKKGTRTRRSSSTTTS